MTPEDLDRLDRIVARLADVAVADQLSQAFYDRLFRSEPATRDLFSDDLTAQREVFVRTLVEIVGTVRNFSQLTDTARSLGSRHRGYGVAAHHYALARDSLLAALAETLPDLDEADLKAWGRGFDLVAELMQQPSVEPSPRGLAGRHHLGE